MGSLSNPVALCHNFSTEKYYKQIPQHFNKTAACSHRCPPQAPSPSTGHWYDMLYLRIFDPGPINPTTFLGLCSPSDYWQSMESQIGVPTFNCTETALASTIYDSFLTLRHKKALLYPSYTFVDINCEKVYYIANIAA